MATNQPINNISQPRNSQNTAKFNNTYQVGANTTNNLYKPTTTAQPTVAKTNTTKTTNTPWLTNNIAQPRDSKNTAKYNNTYQVGANTTNNLYKPREQGGTTPTPKKETVSSTKTATGGQSTQLGYINELQNQIKQLQEENKNLNILCKPDGTPLPPEQQPPEVQKELKKTPKKVNNPQPQPQVEQPQEQEPVDEFAPDFYKQEQPQEEVQEEQPQEENTEKEATIDTENREGVIYGRASGDENTRIETNSDQYSATDTSVRERQNSLNSLLGMSAENIAISINSWYTPFGEQGMRDLQQYAPEKYNLIQQELKELQTMENVNSIASGGSINITSQIQNTTDTINNSIDDRARRNSDPQSYDNTLNNLTEKLASSQTAQSATQEMLNINKDIAEIQAKMENLPNEAKKAFKGDVPDYIYQAYISNKQQEYQAQLNKLQSRYQSASDLYKTELANKQWEAEMEMKQQQMMIQQNQRALEQEFKMSQQNRENNFKTNQFNWNVWQQNRENNFKQNQFNRQVWQQDRENQYKLKQYDLDVSQLKLQSMKTDSSGRVFQINSDGTYTYLSDSTAKVIMDQQVDAGLQALMKKCPQWATWWQCEAVTDEFNRSTYGQEMLPRDKDWNPSKNLWRSRTTAEEKKSYVNTPYLMKWATAVFNYKKSDGVSDAAVTYGHTALIVGIDEQNGTVTYLDGNRKWDEVVRYNTMPIEDFYKKTGLQGFRYPPYDKNLDTIQTNDEIAQSNSVLFDNSMASLYGKYNSWKGLTKEDRNTVDSVWISRKEFMQQATNYKAHLEEQMTPQVQEMINNLQEIKSEMWRIDFINAGVGEQGTRWTEWAYHRSLINQFIASKSLQNLIDMKSQGATFGALSDSELNFISNSATNLNMNLSYGDFMKVIDKTLKILEKGMKTVKTSKWSEDNQRKNPRA